jgi:hypothetical protein
MGLRTFFKIEILKKVVLFYAYFPGTARPVTGSRAMPRRFLGAAFC